MSKNDQQELAETLVPLLPGYDVTAVDILDALATAGLKLANDKTGKATEAYYAALGKKLDER